MVLHKVFGSACPAGGDLKTYSVLGVLSGF